MLPYIGGEIGVVNLAISLSVLEDNFQSYYVQSYLKKDCLNELTAERCSLYLKEDCGGLVYSVGLSILNAPVEGIRS